jgi:flagellar motor switch protein FliN
MSNISPDFINQLSVIQNQVWSTVGLTVSEACGQQVTFGSPLTVSAKTADLYGEIGSPMMIIQFAFAALPDNPQVVLIPQETVEDLASLILGDSIEEIDENTVADIRGALEGIVQGICLSVGTLRSDTVVASGLTIRFQLFSFPPNMQRSTELVRTQVGLTGDNLNGSAIWLMDSDTAHAILGNNREVQAHAPFPQMGGSHTGGGGGGADRTSHPYEDAGALDLLMDIPLEISVELGRVKMLVKEVVELGSGSIVEIDKAAGEPVDVMVNGRLVARGEVVVIEDNFGVRITEILNPQERLNRLGEVA